MKKNGLFKSKILRGKKRFNELFRNGNSIPGKYISVIYKEAEDFKIGFAISQKIRGKVNKNKIKRQLKEIYRTNKVEFPYNMNLILFGRKNKIDYFELKRDVLDVIKSIT